MSKKWILVSFGVIFLAISAVFGVILSRRVIEGTKTTPSSAKQGLDITVVDQPEKPTGDLLYEDESGFSFKYPKNLEVSDITPNDPDYYTRLSLKNLQGEIIIDVKDTKYKTLEEIVTGTLSGATSLGGISAKQFIKEDSFITVALDQDISYLIEGPRDDFWQEVQNIVVSSFSFGQKAQTPASGNTIYEEEVVE